MNVWLAAAWFAGMVALAFCAAASVGPGTTHRERVAQDRQRRQQAPCQPRCVFWTQCRCGTGYRNTDPQHREPTEEGHE